MEIFQSLLKKSPPPSVEGEITFVSGPTGMVTTSDKQALTFNVAECQGFKPSERQIVRIHRVEGMTATGLTWVADPPSPAYDPQAKYANYQLTVLFREKLPSDAEQLRTLLAGDGLNGLEISLDRANFEAPVDNLVVELGGHSLLAQQVHMPFPTAHMDLRKLREPLDPGVSFLGITGPVIPLDRIRPMLGPTLPNPWGSDGVSRTIHRLALRLVDLGGTAVVLNRGGELVMTADHFRRFSGNLADPECVPFGIWLDYATDQNSIFRTWGMLAFGLIDLATELTVSRDSPDFDAELDRATGAVLFAAMTSIRRNLEFSAGEEILVPEQVEIGAYGFRSPSDTAIRYRLEDAGDEPFWLLRRT